MDSASWRPIPACARLNPECTQWRVETLTIRCQERCAQQWGEGKKSLLGLRVDGCHTKYRNASQAPESTSPHTPRAPTASPRRGRPPHGPLGAAGLPPHGDPRAGGVRHALLRPRRARAEHGVGRRLACVPLHAPLSPSCLPALRAPPCVDMCALLCWKGGAAAPSLASTLSSPRSAAHVPILAAAAPIIPVSSPSFCWVRALSIRTKYHTCGWIERILGGTRGNIFASRGSF